MVCEKFSKPLKSNDEIKEFLKKQKYKNFIQKNSKKN